MSLRLRNSWVSEPQHSQKRPLVQASGFGARGGQGRCYPFWVEYSKVRLMSKSYRAKTLLSLGRGECTALS